MWKMALLSIGFLGKSHAAGFLASPALSTRDARRLAAAKSWQVAETMRQRLVPDTGFADPAWRMLLVLYVASKEGKRCSVANACQATGLVEATGLRWVRALAAEGSITTDQALPRDGRVALTARKIADMNALMDAMLDPAPEAEV